MKFYICENCGNIIEYVKQTAVPVMCCGQKMTELVPGTSDGAHEKHVPVVTIDGDKVTVEIGAVEHPMVEAHYIQWIAIETTKGSQRVKLSPADKPRAEFYLAEGDELIAAYEYCNIHGLWKKDIK
jgi:superoxide reductase